MDGGYWDSSPGFADIDADGDFDLFLGKCEGHIDFYLNIGDPTSAGFYLAEEDYQDITVGGIYAGRSCPVLVDIDVDGDLDLFSSCFRGLVHFWENLGDSSTAQFVWITDSLENIDVPGRASLDLIDIDADGDYDLFLGDNQGFIHYYKNIGDSTAFDFELETSSFGLINVGNNASPFFVDIDADGDYDLFVGNKYGYIYYYQNDGTPEQYSFADPIYPWLGIDVGDYASPEFCDVDADGDFDLFVGKDNYSDHNCCGDMQFWRNEGNYQNPMFAQENQMYLTFDVANAGEPDFVDYDHDGDMDMYVLYDCLALLKNVGNADNPSFQVLSLQLLGSYFTAACCDFGDLDNDGDEDLVVAHGWTGIVEFWECDGDTSWPGFSEQSQMTVGGLLGAPALGDLDADGDLDMLIHGDDGNMDDRLYHFENQGTPERFNFVLVDSNFQGICTETGVPNLVDFDDDGDLDLMLGNMGTSDSIWYYENQGTPQVPYMVLITQNLLSVPVDFVGDMAEFVDIDNDEDIDVFAGTGIGGIRFYRNITNEPQVGPKRRIGPPIRSGNAELVYHPATGITFDLPSNQNITLAVYNLLGRKVTTIVSGRQPAGTHSFLWNPSQHASGVYIIRLETPQEALAKRVLVVK